MFKLEKIIKPAKKDKNNFKVIRDRFFAKKEKAHKLKFDLDPYNL